MHGCALFLFALGFIAAHGRNVEDLSAEYKVAFGTFLAKLVESPLTLELIDQQANTEKQAAIEIGCTTYDGGEKIGIYKDAL